MRGDQHVGPNTLEPQQTSGEFLPGTHEPVVVRGPAQALLKAVDVPHLTHVVETIAAEDRLFAVDFHEVA